MAYADRFKDRLKDTGRNMHEATAGGGTIPAGKGMMRLVGAVEIGKQKKIYNGAVKFTKQIMLTWELSGKKWPEDNGRNMTRSQRYTNSDSSKAELHKMFLEMDPHQEYTHIAQLLNEVFIGEIVHKKSKSSDKVFANVSGIAYPIQEDPATGEELDYRQAAAPRTGKLMGFVWDFPTLEDWDNLYIEGKYDDGGSRNVLQQSIRAADDFEGSPIWDLLQADQRDPWADYPDPDQDAIRGSASSNRKEVKAKNDNIRERDDEGDDGDDEAPRSRRRSGSGGSRRGEDEPAPRGRSRRHEEDEPAPRARSRRRDDEDDAPAPRGRSQRGAPLEDDMPPPSRSRSGGW